VEEARPVLPKEESIDALSPKRSQRGGEGNEAAERIEK